MDRPPEPRTIADRVTSYAIATAALLVLGGHLAATLVYLSPPNVAKEHLGGPADAYMKPLFAQNWHLFSPNPGVSTRKLAVRCGDDGGAWSEWFDPLEGLTAEHYDNRISGVGKVLYVYRAVGDDLRGALKRQMQACIEAQSDPATVGEACSPDALMDTMVETDEFDLAMRYTQHVCESHFEAEDRELASLQFKLLEFFPVKYADREEADETGRLWGKVHEVFFPVIEGE